MGAMMKHAHMALSALCLLAWSGAADAAALAPHRAIYDLSLVEASDAVGITGADGRLVIEMDDLCDSWAASERMVLRMRLDDGSQTMLDYRYSALEAKDGSAFRFSGATFADGAAVEGGAGRVRTGEDSARIVAFDAPETPDLPLPDEAEFPAGLLSRMIDAAAAGRRSFEGLLFDGVSESPLSIASAAIGPSGTDESAPDGFEDLTRWRVSAAYFDPDAPDGRPEYEVGFILYENGVTSRMTMAYKDFTLDARLSGVMIRPPCEPD